jgi:oligopeptide/dipeptide ABC transporter ATP-binding protein
MNAEPDVDAKPLIEVRGLVKHYPIRQGVFDIGPRSVVRAVDGVDFSVGRGDTLGLVGESGCGKSTTGRLVLRLIDPTAGEVRYDGVDLVRLPHRKMQSLRRELQIVFQDPFGSLDPRMTIERIISEPLAVHATPRRTRRGRVLELLDLVGLAQAHAERYPHELSGGQRQRVCIARALALNPSFVVCDEAVSALDVSVQAQILNLLQDLQANLGLAYLFISHNLGVVRHIARRVAVMYLGRIVEIGNADTLFASPRHPYTEALLSSIPVPDPDCAPPRLRLTGDAASAGDFLGGCRFRSRCQYAEEICHRVDPSMSQLASDHFVACHRASAQALPRSS